MRCPDYRHDPVGDAPPTIRPACCKNTLHRALMVATPTCAVHCRYCFRRHYDYPTSTPRTLEDWQPSLGSAGRRSGRFEEVILSGGDPLVLTDQRLEELCRGSAQHPASAADLRIHTRLPIVIPQRITDALLSCCARTRLTTIVVIHANHPAELDATSWRHSLGRLVDAGIPVLNQSVLLRGVNDRVETLVEAQPATGRPARDAVLPAPTGSGRRGGALSCSGRQGRQLIAQMRIAIARLRRSALRARATGASGQDGAGLKLLSFGSPIERGLCARESPQIHKSGLYSK